MYRIQVAGGVNGIEKCTHGKVKVQDAAHCSDTVRFSQLCLHIHNSLRDLAGYSEASKKTHLSDREVRSSPNNRTLRHYILTEFQIRLHNHNLHAVWVLTNTQQHIFSGHINLKTTR